MLMIKFMSCRLAMYRGESDPANKSRDDDRWALRLTTYHLDQAVGRHVKQFILVQSLRHGGMTNYPTLPSKLTSNNFCASTANSIGNSFNTCLQKPFTNKAMASSCEMPLC